MTTIQRSAFVPYTPSQMFDLVNDIARYPEFIPWCPDAEIIRANGQEVEATLHFTKGAFRKSFTTINKLYFPEKIDMNLKEGPFEQLEGSWQFKEIAGQGCQIILQLSFEFNSLLLSVTLGPVFNQMTSSLVDAFTKRAHQVYAKEITA